MDNGDFVELNREFCVIDDNATEHDDYEYFYAYLAKKIQWQDLLEQYRVVIIAEAGAGKTREIQEQVKRLQAQGKSSFFLRIENIENGDLGFDDLESPKRFEAWLNSENEAWIFLDSVDEARLKNSNQFDEALRVIGNKLAPAMKRTHFYISSRRAYWRSQTDPSLIRKWLPFSVEDKKEYPLEFYTFNLLDSTKIKKFVEHRNVSADFLVALARTESKQLAGRPFDLIELIEYWNKYSTLGTPRSRMEFNVKSRLTEHDQNRNLKQQLTFEAVSNAAKRLAAAATLQKHQTIQLNGSGSRSSGLSVSSVLPNWTAQQHEHLLGRAIFDDQAFGAVRFRHRSVREYLTAQWFVSMLPRASRESIESLFFKTTYGVEVIEPSLRPVLQWLMLDDQLLRDKALRIAPEMIFECADPSVLPLELRQKKLKEVCAAISANQQVESVWADAEKFASRDLGPTISGLLSEFSKHDRVERLLLMLAWKGDNLDCIDAGVTLASDTSRTDDIRVGAARVALMRNSDSSFDAIWKSVASETGRVPVKLFVELLRNSRSSRIDLVDLFSVIKRDPYSGEHWARQADPDFLRKHLKEYARTVDPKKLLQFSSELCQLLQRAPISSDYGVKISREFQWLLPVANVVVCRMIKSQSRDSLTTSVFSILILNDSFSERDKNDDGSEELKAGVVSWLEFNRELFWFDVMATRERRSVKSERVHHINFMGFSTPWTFSSIDFDWAVSNVEQKEFIDDRLVAFSLAYRIYANEGKPIEWLNRLTQLSEANQELATSLENHLNPPIQSWQLTVNAHEQKMKELDDKRTQGRSQEIEYFKTHAHLLRDNRHAINGHISEQQNRIYHFVDTGNVRHDRLERSNWRSLIPTFGDEVASAFRDGSVDYWRRFRPQLPSERAADNNSIPGSDLIGLTGLQIESEEKNWPKKLSTIEAEIACRYALRELNQFPSWFGGLHQQFPSDINRILASELDKEIKAGASRVDLLWRLESNSFLHQHLANKLFDSLESTTIITANHLLRCVTILRLARFDDSMLVALAKRRTLETKRPEWFALWVDQCPDEAMVELKIHLETFESAQLRNEFAVHFLTYLFGDRKKGMAHANAFNTAEHLKSLFVLAYECAPPEKDRPSGEAYTPNIYDDAASARNRIQEMITALEGKDSYLAMNFLAQTVVGCEWFNVLAARRAIADSEMEAWSIEQVLDFEKEQSFTPTTATQLFDLVLMQLRALKHDLENSDGSQYELLLNQDEIPIRKYIGNWLRERAHGRYSVPQEEELADGKRTDLRFHGAGIDAAIPVELKIANKHHWSGSSLIERMKSQLCGDYLRDCRSERGVFLLVCQDDKRRWEIKGSSLSFDELLATLEKEWLTVESEFPNIASIEVIGIDLTHRAKSGRVRSGLKANR
jgi:hypothetical protein